MITTQKLIHSDTATQESAPALQVDEASGRQCVEALLRPDAPAVFGRRVFALSPGMTTVQHYNGHMVHQPERSLS